MVDVFIEGQILDTHANQQKRYRIGDVARLLDLRPHVLRYWESEFGALILGEKTEGGQRLYSRQDIEIFGKVKQLLYSEGYSIAGAKKRLIGLIKEERNESEGSSVPRELLSVLKEELEDIRDDMIKMRSSIEDINISL